MELTSTNVDTVIKDCLYTDEEVKGKEPKDLIESGAVVAQGVILQAGFHPERLKKHEPDVVSMLGQLPKAFHAKTGGGWSFLNACMREDGEQWGEQRDVDALITMGLALKKVEFCMPRDMWAILPGGVPYFVVNA